MKPMIPLIALSLLLGGCKVDVYESVIAPNLDLQLEKAGYSSEDRESVQRIGKSVIKSMEDITPEQEYYIGRTVAANIFSRYRPYQDKMAQAYINKIGTLLTYHSDLPNTYGGYHFMILDSDEINAFAAPGGFIFVTRGMLRCTDSEDAVAAVLAHEIAHVTHKHGLQAIKSSRWTRVGTLLGVEAVKRGSSEEFAELVSIFEESIDDVINTLVVNGYSREFELEADKTALQMLQGLGYNPAALADMLRIMERRIKPGGMDFARTHPAPQQRIAGIQSSLTYRSTTTLSRQQRYERVLGGI
ncbi:MAG: M48 family metalloprotease [Sulfurimonadaceae bacterium]|nr:M48 family metalloprotease [Sulfurimonadaceae bacterium]